MNPIARELFARIGFALRDFVFVMREDEVVATAVNVDLFAEFGKVHCRALNVPTRATFAPRTFPENFAGLRGFPEREVHGMIFRFAYFDARAGLHIIDLAPREFAIILVTGYAEIDITIGGRI